MCVCVCVCCPYLFALELLQLCLKGGGALLCRLELGCKCLFHLARGNGDLKRKKNESSDVRGETGVAPCLQQ